MAPAGRSPWSDLDRELLQGRAGPELLVSIATRNGRFALAVDQRHRPQGQGRVLREVWRKRMIFLVDPRSGEEVVLVSPTRNYNEERVRKVVFAPKPNDNWTVMALYNNHQVAYMHGKVDNKWTTVDVITHMDCLLDMAYDPAGGDKSGAGRGRALATLVLNADPTTGYALPYDVASSVMITKYIFFCHGSLYQVWKNTSANFNSSNNHFRMSTGEILVLRLSGSV
uniref:DUF295 domain-containing protein n=1 Tax=Aegilops tauschii TaxID=37682 RepID=M8CMP7_AEGTA